jgi:hypothetical protein
MLTFTNTCAQILIPTLITYIDNLNDFRQNENDKNYYQTPRLKEALALNFSNLITSGNVRKKQANEHQTLTHQRCEERVSSSTTLASTKGLKPFTKTFTCCLFSEHSICWCSGVHAVLTGEAA